MSTSPVPDIAAFTVLVVDDTPAILSLLAKHLEEHRLQVVVAEEGEEAIHRCHLVRPDLILLDVMMPGMDGFETCRRLKATEATRDIPVIFMTALTDTQSKVIGFSVGGVDFVTKPIQLKEVLARVQTHLALRALQKGLERRVAERTAELAQTNRMLRVLSDCNQTLVRATDESELLQDICRIIVERGGYPLAWVGWAEQDEARTLRPVAQKGGQEGELGGELEAACISWADNKRGQGPAGTAIRSGKPCIVQDTQTDPILVPWRVDALRRDSASCLALPLPGDDRVLGALIIHAAQTDAFHAQEVELLMELADDLAYGVKALRTQAARARVEEALRGSEERYRSLFDGVPVGLYRSAPSGAFLDVNPALVQMLGYPDREALLAVNANELYVDAGDRAHWTASIEAEGKVQDYEARVRRGDGTTIWMRDTGRAVREANGQIACYEGSFDDITERKRGEEALRLSEDRYRALYMDNPSMYFTMDAQGTVLSVNPFGAEQLGYSVPELVGQNVLRVFHPYDRTAVSDQFAACLRTPGQIAHWEFRKVRKDGSLLWVREAARAVQGAGGSPVVLIVCEDVTDRKQAEEKLRQLKEFNEGIVQNMAEGLIVLDDRGNIDFVNPAQAGLLGYAPADLMGRRWATIMVPPEQQAVGGGAEAGRIRVGRYELELVRKDGTRVPVLASISLHAYGDPGAGFLVVVTDLSERKQLESQLLQAQKMEAVGRMAGGVAHDFNNLLTAIVGFSDLLLDGFQADDPRRMDVEVIRKAADRAGTLTRQLLIFSRRKVLRPRVLDLNSTIENIETMFRRLIGEDIELRTVLSASPAFINADPAQVEQVLMNLVVNSRDAMPQGGQLLIETSSVTLDAGSLREQVGLPAGAYVMLAVTDTGTGMSEETLAHVFEPFFTTKAEGKGTGLGLSMVYGIVTQSGGHVAVESRLGRGTTFRLFLPAATEDAGPDGPSTPPLELTSGSETILLVEDDDAVRDLARRILRESGYSVLDARTGPEALALSEQSEGPIHLLLTDVVLPGGMSGSVLRERMLALRPQIRVLCISGYAPDAALRHGVQKRDIPFLEKPFRPAVLRRTVRALLDAPSAD